MPRKARDERLDTRTARLKLRPRREPYWRSVQEGRAIGYRRLAGGKAGSWIARYYQPADGRKYKALGAADDMIDADGVTALTFAQAQIKAVAWFQEVDRNQGRTTKPLTVREAIEHYLDDYKARGGKAPAYLETTFKAHVLPKLGDMLVADLAPETIRRWHHSLATAPARLRTKKGAVILRTRSATDPDAQRARRATANGVMTMLKAALNLAYREGRAASDDAWRRVRPFQKVDAPRIRYLTDEEANRLANACPAELRALVTAALFTGCRYQELATLRPADVDLAAGVASVRGKSGKPRSVVLTAEAGSFFRQAMAGKARDAIILPRADSAAWGKSHQFRPLREACAVAKIRPAVSFHILRHTHGSRLAMKGVPMAVIAAQLGHSSVKITERHYAHLSPNYVADTIRLAFGNLGLTQETCVVPMHR